MESAVNNARCTIAGQCHRVENCSYLACQQKGRCVGPTVYPAFDMDSGEITSDDIMQRRLEEGRKAPLQVIGLSGKAGSGKDFIAREVLEPMGYRKFALAWPMKNEGCGLGFTYEEVHDTKPPHVREWLQKRGTEQGWMIHGQRYWLEIARAWMRTLRDNYGIHKFVVTDARFPHEVDFIHEMGGHVFRITGERATGLLGAAAQHSSETALDAYPFQHYLINNFDTTIAEHTARIRRVIG